MKKLVTGFGGFFFRAKDPKALAAWYETHFGINAMGSNPTPWRQEEGTTIFAPFKADTNYYPADQDFMINLRVTDMVQLLENLRKAGVHIDEQTHEDSIGKFAWVYDPEGNKIELWEPGEGKS